MALKGRDVRAGFFQVGKNLAVIKQSGKYGYIDRTDEPEKLGGILDGCFRKRKESCLPPSVTGWNQTFL